MTPEQEKQLLEAIYDRLFDAVTYQPSGSKNPFTEEETFIHFAKNAALSPASYHNPRTPSNPLGDLKASEAFSRMVDYVSPLTLEWDNTGASLSETYTDIVNGVVIQTEPDPKAKEMYDKAYNYLHPVVKEKNPFSGEETETQSDSKDFTDYLDNMDTYVAAIMAYRSNYNIYLDDLENPDKTVSSKADRNWQAKAPGLENAIKAAFRKLTAGNAKYVEQALAILNTTINDGVRRAFERAQEAVAPARRFSSSTGTGSDWLFSYPVPADWTDGNNPNFTELKISGGNTKLRSKATEHSFSVDTSFNAGLWRVKANASGSFEHRNSSADKNTVEISARIAKVNIMRPWFNESIFRLANWMTNEVDGPGGISNGKIDSSNRKNLMPMFPVAFIVAKDIQIKAGFSHEEEEHIKQQIKTGASVGWGPFSIGGSYGYGKTEDKFDSDFQDGTIKVPGMQIIGWVSRVTPFSPKGKA